MNIQQAEDRLQEILNEQFPKGMYDERGHALVLYAEAVYLMRKLK